MGKIKWCVWGRYVYDWWIWFCGRKGMRDWDGKVRKKVCCIDWFWMVFLFWSLDRVGFRWEEWKLKFEVLKIVNIVVEFWIILLFFVFFCGCNGLFVLFCLLLVVGMGDLYGLWFMVFICFFVIWLLLFFYVFIIEFMVEFCFWIFFFCVLYLFVFLVLMLVL